MARGLWFGLLFAVPCWVLVYGLAEAVWALARLVAR